MGKLIQKIKNIDYKKHWAVLVTAFLAITAGVVTTSKVLNDRANKEAMARTTIESSKRVVLAASEQGSAESIEASLKADEVDYEKISDGIFVASYDSSDAVKEALEKYSSDNVSVAEDSVFVTLTEDGSNEEATEEVSEDVSTDTSEETVEAIDLSEELPEGYTWKQLAEERGQKLVAVIDTEVGRYATTNYNFTDEEIDLSAADLHGTIVAKEIYDNANGKAMIIGLKAMRRDGYGYMTDVMKAVQFAKDNLNADVINMSIATDASDDKDAFVSQIKDVVNSGITVVAAAGNYQSDSSAYYPAGIEGVITVGAVDETGTKTSTSNWGNSVDYYENADSTSQAAGKLTGKLVSGEDLSQEITKDTVVIKEEDKNEISKSILEQIYATDATQYAVSTEKRDTKSDIGVLYDETSDRYYYLYETEEKLFKDWPRLTDKPGQYYTVIRLDDFNTQYAYINGYKCGTFNVSSKGNGRWKIKTGTDYVLPDSDVWKRGDFTGYFNYAFNTTNDVWSYEINAEADSGYYVAYSKTNYASSWDWIESYNWTISGLDNCKPVIDFYKLPTYTYKLSYSANGGTGAPASESKTITHGDANPTFTISSTKPTRTGYTFDNRWNTASNGTGSNYYPNGSITINQNVTLYAMWNANTYILTVDPNGGTYNGSLSKVDKNVTYDQGYWNVLGSASRSGYQFLGWATGQQSDNQLIKGTIAGTQIYDADGVAIKVDGYWDNKQGSWKHDGDVTVYAQWKRLDYKLTMNLNDSDGAGGIKASLNGIPSSITVTYGLTSNNNLGKKPQRKGYKFLGWYTKASSGSDSKQVYDANGNHVNDTTHWKDDKWNTTSDLTLYAHWEATKYSVTYNINGEQHVRNGVSINRDTYTDKTNQRATGTTSSNNDVKYDTSFTMNNNGYSWKGHTWLGWSESATATSATFSNKQNFSYGQIVEQNGRYWDYNAEKWKNKDGSDLTKINLYAIWNVEKHTITINPTSEANDTIQEESFDGTWSGAHNGEAKATNGSNAITITAYWGDKIDLGKAVPPNETRTITYDVNGENVTIDRASDTVSLFFNRWNYDSASNKIGDFANDVDISNGADDAFLAVQDKNSSVVARYYFNTVVLPTPTREGYNFLGWYYDAECTKKATGKNNSRGNGGSVYRTTKDETLYARWEKTSYNYSETMQSFIQDESDEDSHVYMYKLNGVNGTPLTEITDASTGKQVGFTIELYKGSVSSNNLILTLKTDKGVFDSTGKKIVDYQFDGIYEITNYLTAGTTYIAHEIDVPKGWLLARDESYLYDGKNNLEITLEDKQTGTPPEDNSYFIKTDKYGRAISNATFSLYDETDKDNEKFIRNFTTNDLGQFEAELDENGEATITMFNYCEAGHTYSLTEIDCPEGFEKVDKIYFTIPQYSNDEEVEPIYVEETVDTTIVQIKKINSDDKPLEGAVFQLFMKDEEGELVPCYKDSDGNWVNASENDEDVQNGTYKEMTSETNSEGIATFTNIPIRANFTGSEEDYTKSYYIKEIKAPKGYSILTEIFEVRIPESAKNSTITYTVKDDSITLTLETGGNGTNLYVAFGMGLIAVALVLVAAKKKQEGSQNL